MPLVGAAEDAFGCALLDFLAERPGPQLILERDDGDSGPALQPAEFFAPYESWPPWEQRAMDRVEGSVLDLGAGAGRHAVHLQGRGHEVTAVDWSPGAVQVCRSRGVHDVRLTDLTEFEGDRRWNTALLMCGNLGLAGDWEPTRRLLVRLGAMISPSGVLIGDSVDPSSDDPNDAAYEERNRRCGRHRGATRLRLRYGTLLTPWWNQINLSPGEVPGLVDGTGWSLEEHVRDGEDHLVVLRRQQGFR
jgi:SAM-dependent methyltransferase